MNTDKATENQPSSAAVEGPRLSEGLGGLQPERDDSPRLTPEQRARLISGGPNAGRVRRVGCYECAWGKVLGCWRCGGR